MKFCLRFGFRPLLQYYLKKVGSRFLISIAVDKILSDFHIIIVIDIYSRTFLFLFNYFLLLFQHFLFFTGINFILSFLTKRVVTRRIWFHRVLNFKVFIFWFDNLNSILNLFEFSPGERNLSALNIPNSVKLGQNREGILANFGRVARR